MSEAAINPDQGTAGAAGAQASAGGSTESSRIAESDFKERARRDPDFAWEQVRQFQSKADKAQSAEENYQRLVEQVGDAKSLIEQYGGGTVAAAVQHYAALRSSQELGETIQAFERTGQLSTRRESGTKDDSEDEYLTAEEKELRDLRETVKRLEARQTQQSFSAGRETLKRHMEDVFAEFGFTEEHQEKIRQKVVSQFEMWGNAGAAGEQALNSLMTANGRDTVKGIMLSGISAEELRAAASNVALRKQQGLSGLATDGPGGVGSAGKELPSNFGSAIEVAKAARANPDAFDSR